MERKILKINTTYGIVTYSIDSEIFRADVNEDMDGDYYFRCSVSDKIIYIPQAIIVALTENS
jgi:hypothetical protein